MELCTLRLLLLQFLLSVASSAYMSSEPHVASAQEILDAKARLDGLLLEMSARSANGKAASGRYKKHDTARLSYINTVALPGLRWGKLPPEADWRMLFLPGDIDITGPDKVAMDKWTDEHHRDPRKELCKEQLSSKTKPRSEAYKARKAEKAKAKRAAEDLGEWQ